LVSKSRSLEELATLKVGNATIRTFQRVEGQETMADNSVTGSARTDIPAVDRYLATHGRSHRDFNRALTEDNLTIGDAGLHSFAVDRFRREVGTLSYELPDAGKTQVQNDYVLTGWSGSHWPVLTDFDTPSENTRKSVGQQAYLNSLPRDQADLAVLIGEIALNPVRALAVPGQASVKAASRQVRGKSARRKAAVRRHRQIRGLPLEEARAAADDYLAYIFGVRPTVSSLDALAESLTRSRRHAETISRHGTRRYRRRKTVRYLNRSASSLAPPHTIYVGTGNQFQGSIHLFRSSTQRIWWSGAFRMTPSYTDDWLGRCSSFFHEVDYLTGLGLDVRAAWDLIPFSFMADWFANTGDFLEARQIIADYNVVSEYGYIMCHTRQERQQIALGGIRVGISPPVLQPVSVLSTEVRETKRRDACKAFGFETDFSGLNAFQWSALTALGLSFGAGLAPKTRS